MTTTITTKERNALYLEIILRLGNIEALSRAIVAEDFETADQIGREVSDFLIVLLNDLGWGEIPPAESRGFELITEPRVLRRVLERLHGLATIQYESDRRDARAAKADEAHSEFTMNTCSKLLDDLDG